MNPVPIEAFAGALADQQAEVNMPESKPGRAPAGAGEYVREAAQFRNWVTPDGSPGPGGEGGFTAAPGRYHLYISHACPWCHRAMIVRRLKGLENVISVSVVHPWLGAKGWEFRPYPGATEDDVHGVRYLRELYLRARPDYSGRFSVPLLWDRERDTAVSNESSEIIRMFNRAFDVSGDAELDLYPEPLRPAIDALNARVYEHANNGVYRAGFATTQAAYERAFDGLFETLTALEARLSGQRYLVGTRPTEADWRLFPTLVRFDPVYHYHFKCNLRRIADYPNLSNYLRDLYQYPGIAETVNMDHIKRHYYTSHTRINPHGIIPKGPVLELTAPHDRDRFARN